MNWCRSNCDTTVDLDVKSVLFGIPNYTNDQFIYCMNICILYAKWYIYCCKRDEEQLFFLTFVTMLKNVLQTEKVRCQINNEKHFDEKIAWFYEKF